MAAAVLLLASLGWAQQNNLIEEIQIHGNRRIPAETIRARMYTRAGDVYDANALNRDFMSLWNTGYFEDLRFEREASPKGWRIHVYVKEKPTIREITYVGLNSVSQSDVLDRYKERKVGLSVESQYDPTRVKKAEVVLKELLSEHGRQFATVTAEVQQIPPASVRLILKVKEGPKVKVGNIKFEGNRKLGSRELRRAMKNLRPIGIPYSIFLEDLFSKTYDASKLSEDQERVRDAYQQKGYFKALVQDPKTKIRDTGTKIPFIIKAGKRVDITIPIEEGERYRLKEITFTGNKAITNTKALRSLFPMKDGDVFDTDQVRKGLKNLRDAYTEFGFINFTPVPDTEIDDEHKLITLKIDVDEGKKFFVRRIEFQGNTTTRDKVIRRELALEEGQVYNSKLWELSLLRLNQLQYFEQLKPDQDTERHIDEQSGTVDLTLKVKEKGKNSIGLTGGVSGLAGSFIGLNYQTNNFLGLGETLTVEADVGSRERNIMFGFTEPYMFDRPLNLGFTVFSQRYDYNQAQETAIATGVQLNLPQNVLQSLQNYRQSSTGFTMSASYPLHRSFKRVGITYSFDTSSITAFSDASKTLFESLAFRNISGPNALLGVKTSKIIPSFSFSTIDNPMRPHRGQSLYMAAEFAGLGGTVRDIRPVIEYKRWIPMNKDRNALGFRVLGSFLTGWGGEVAPPFSRFYMGGENDVRGFDIRAISPYVLMAQTVAMTLTNPDGTPVPRDPANPRRGNVTIPLPVYSLTIPGGDTNIVGNVEYRIPIAGPVTVALFNDIGMDFVARSSQLQLSAQSLNALNATQFGCPFLDAFYNCGGTVAPGTGGIPVFSGKLSPISGTNFVPRMSTGAELQVVMPVVNAPFRIYWAYNTLRLNTLVNTPVLFTRDMFPPTGAGQYSYQQALAAYGSSYRLKEPRSTFRFTVATTF
jgi:outer membrane protein insertion porin family